MQQNNVSFCYSVNYVLSNQNSLLSTIIDNRRLNLIIMKSRNEIDFLRLLRQCQNIANQREWRLEKYVDALSERLEDLRSQNVNQLSRDTLEEYERKTQFLRGLIETEKLPSAEKRLLAAELLAPDSDTRATLIIAKNKYQEQIRHDLLLSERRRFGDRGSNRSGLRQGDDNDVSEDITQNLLELTNNIRETMQAANTIIQKDTETLSTVAGGADTISMRMQKNTDKLTEFIRKGYQFGIWIALFIVTCTFLMMVIFIRLFPKPVIVQQ